MNALEAIEKDFDRIALLTECHGSFAAGEVYNKYLIKLVPAGTASILEVGSGAGRFSSLLARRTARLTGIDLSPEMVRLAQSSNLSNAEFRCVDFLRAELPTNSFDVVISVATLHHLPLDLSVQKMKDVLRPGGILVIHDLVEDQGLADLLRNFVAVPSATAYRFWTTGKPWMPAELKNAWAEHGKNESYLTMAQLRDLCSETLPGAVIKRHLLWRYTLVWQKDASVS